MPTKYKVLGQVTPTANTYFDVYSVPTGNSTVISTINVCNQSLSNVIFRIAVKVANTTPFAWPTSKQFIAYDVALPAQDAIGLSLGMTLDATDTITVHSFQGNVSFNLFGSEIY